MFNQVFFSPAEELWQRLLDFIPSFVKALLFLVVGWFVAKIAAFLIERFVKLVNLDSLLRKVKFDRYVEKMGLRLNSGKFFGDIAYWVVVLLVLLTASDILGLMAFSSFLLDVINHIPILVGAAFILIFAVVAADFVRGAVKASATAARLHLAKLLGTLAWWTVMIFGAVQALKQLGVDTRLSDNVITVIIAGVALAFGLAFGLGGKESAERILRELREQGEKRD
jgi:hypothetical protein